MSMIASGALTRDRARRMVGDLRRVRVAGIDRSSTETGAFHPVGTQRPDTGRRL
jgi:hypothetical protein